MPRPALLTAVACGGAVGAVLRYAVGVAVPDGGGFPWTTFAINVLGSGLLALLPALAFVRRRELLVVGLGPGLLGGFTTLSAASEQTRALLDGDRPVLAGVHAVGTLAACLLAVTLVSALSTLRSQRTFEDEGGDE